ncbi:NAD(P)-dependent alcohol dehydrogenase [Sinorhizobium medicae]|uniref:NAD(P)-dependent alcohol dehydrogenase n=1 Tax=Sinorhizobium medicae TaxID=110321 RepID=UPI000FD978D3|nr:NAD(P)-dependent alcohol dehydrogenase [Sinorhizobium medicae]RVO73551.1 NAD(P)-dependent alcohol dehydrogenase [Sinorhizobium medicae]
MFLVKARCTCGPHQPFQAVAIERRELGPTDVLIDIAYAGICHTDIHYAHDQKKGKTSFPLVPGHEIAGVVAAVGSKVTKFKVGDRAGMGVMCRSCQNCEHCRKGLEQYCTGKRVLTYNSIDYDGKLTYGGYSEKIVADENFVIRVPETIPLANAAPMFCAGITVYSPLRHWKAGPGKRVAILGFGGLGHLGVQIAKAMGAHVTVLDLSLAKQEDGYRLGADEYRATTDPGFFAEFTSAFDILISTVPANLDMDKYLSLLALDGVFVNISSSQDKPLSVTTANLLMNRRSISGTRSGGIAETQEMIDFCAKHGVMAQVEIVGADQIEECFERIGRGDVRFRFVIDGKSISGGPDGPLIGELANASA